MRCTVSLEKGCAVVLNMDEGGKLCFRTNSSSHARLLSLRYSVLLKVRCVRNLDDHSSCPWNGVKVVVTQRNQR